MEIIPREINSRYQIRIKRFYPPSYGRYTAILTRDFSKRDALWFEIHITRYLVLVSLSLSLFLFTGQRGGWSIVETMLDFTKSCEWIGIRDFVRRKNVWIDCSVESIRWKLMGERKYDGSEDRFSQWILNFDSKLERCSCLMFLIFG